MSHSNATCWNSARSSLASLHCIARGLNCVSSHKQFKAASSSPQVIWCSQADELAPTTPFLMLNPKLISMQSTGYGECRPFSDDDVHAIRCVALNNVDLQRPSLHPT
eukprot:420352-Pleurochrysis_carterae.AAC.2